MPLIHSLIRVALVSTMILIPIGCGEQPPRLEAEVTTPVGRAGVCSHCEKTIETVGEEHLVTIDGVQYVVCDEQCAAGLREWIESQ